MKLMNAPRNLLFARNNVEYFDDFEWYVDVHFWTADTSDDNDTTPAVNDAEHGQLTLTAVTDDNEETGIFSTKEIALFQAGCRMIFETRVKYAEGNTSAANVAMGLCDAPNIDDWITDNGGALNPTGSGVAIYKLDGGTVWRGQVRNNSVTRDIVSEYTAGGTVFHNLTIECAPLGDGTMDVMYFLDDKLFTESTFHRYNKPNIAYASATEMNIQLYLKIGSSTAETVLVDYMYYGCLRV